MPKIIKIGMTALLGVTMLGGFQSLGHATKEQLEPNIRTIHMITKYSFTSSN
ncbi:hypothetical protein [Enterococcus faecium]|uniref:hypothetical protein n=1 Tax=Enterococcus faecium TaxID=1352 RepID=UPI003395A2B1